MHPPPCFVNFAKKKLISILCGFFGKLALIVARGAAVLLLLRKLEALKAVDSQNILSQIGRGSEGRGGLGTNLETQYKLGNAHKYTED